MVGRRERCPRKGLAWLQPAHRAGGSQGLYTSPAAEIGAAACLGLPPCLSTALGGVEPGPTASWFLTGAAEPQSLDQKTLPQAGTAK